MRWWRTIRRPSISTYRIHFAQGFSAAQVRTALAERRRAMPVGVQAEIDAAWAAAMARRGVALFDGPMVRLESWRIEGGCLHLDLGRTSFKTFLGTNLTRPDLPVELLANPLGLSALLQSADGYLMLGRRNAGVAHHGGRVHPFAGTAVEGDVFAEMRRELAEEAGLAAGDITAMQCVGLAEDLSIRQPELIFGVLSNKTRAEIEGGVNKEEHGGVVAIAAGEAARAMEDVELTPIASAALGLWTGMTGFFGAGS